MANEASGFFNAEYDADSDFWDRVYTADQFADYFAKLVSNGVFEGGLQVKQHSDSSTAMDVRVVTGKAMINGYWYSLNEETYFNVDVNTSSSVRVDCVCLQYNFSNRTINVVYHKNTSQPVRNGEMYELMIATINVGSEATSISQSAITDTRFNSAYCGIVTGLITQIDFDEAYAQFTTWFNEYKQEIIHEFDDAGEMAKEIFNAWFQHMKGQLDSDAAGHLQLEVDDVNEIIADAYSVASLYEVGDYVTYENHLYECIVAVTTRGPFNPSNWSERQVQPQISSVKTTVARLEPMADGFESAVTEFNSDGSITTTYSDRVKKTVFNPNGSITETLTRPGALMPYLTKNTVFNADGSITETVTLV